MCKVSEPSLVLDANIGDKNVAKQDSLSNQAVHSIRINPAKNPKPSALNSGPNPNPCTFPTPLHSIFLLPITIAPLSRLGDNMSPNSYNYYHPDTYLISIRVTNLRE